MAKNINDIFSKFAKGTPKGLGSGLGALLAAGGLIYGISESIFTGLK